MSLQVPSFLTTVSRYQVSLKHLTGKASLPSDLTSCNALDCNKLNCRICTFVHDMQDSLYQASRSGISSTISPGSHSPQGQPRLQIQSDCPDLRRVYAHLKEGIRPSKKLKLTYVKRYLNCTSLAKEGDLVVKHSQPFVPVIEAIVIPRSILDGLLTAVHIKLHHSSRH